MQKLLRAPYHKQQKRKLQHEEHFLKEEFWSVHRDFWRAKSKSSRIHVLSVGQRWRWIQCDADTSYDDDDNKEFNDDINYDYK